VCWFALCLFDLYFICILVDGISVGGRGIRHLTRPFWFDLLCRLLTANFAFGAFLHHPLSSRFLNPLCAPGGSTIVGAVRLPGSAIDGGDRFPFVLIYHRASCSFAVCGIVDLSQGKFIVLFSVCGNGNFCRTSYGVLAVRGICVSLFFLAGIRIGVAVILRARPQSTTPRWHLL
jgi:hypothetical protein